MIAAHIGWHSVQWGDAAGWLTGVATLGLLAVTWWQIAKTRTHIDRLPDRLAQVNNSRAMARRNHFSVESIRLPGSSVRDDGVVAAVAVGNLGDEPIWRVQVKYGLRRSQRVVTKAEPMSEDALQADRKTPLSKMRSGEVWFFLLPNSPAVDAVDEDRIRIRFDCGDIRWESNVDGHVIEAAGRRW